jgi:hypothetical protein
MAAPPKDAKGTVALIAQIASVIIAGTALTVTLMKDDRAARDMLERRLTVLECQAKIIPECK